MTSAPGRTSTAANVTPRAWTQAARTIAISTVLGDDALALRALVYSEAMSTPYCLIARVSPNPGHTPTNANTPATTNTGPHTGPQTSPHARIAQLIGTDVALRLTDHQNADRHLTGVVVRVTRPGRLASGSLGNTSADLTIVPRLWLATRHIDCKIFQDRTVLEIVADVLARYAVKLDVRCRDRYAPSPYTVQYRESDFHFVSRLLEHHGIAYHFEHTPQHQSMVLTDSPGQHPDLPGTPSIPFAAHDKHDRQTSMATWWSQATLRPASVVLSEYDYVKPSADLRAASALEPKLSSDPHASPLLPSAEHYDWRAHYLVLPEGERLARLRAEELAANAETFQGHTHLRTPRAGHVFALTDPTGALAQGFEGRYLVRAVTLIARADDYDDHDTTSTTDHASALDGLAEPLEHTHPAEPTLIARALAKGAPTATTHLQAQHAQLPFRPQRLHAKPTVAGPQTAVVTGAGGEEIHTDKYGRVKVKFRWDRHGPADQRSSCWLRSAQAWAGKGWGGIQIPRIGQEVIVDFIEGDPDEPIITGRVYNAESMPPVSGAGRDPKKGETNPKDMMEAAMQTSMRSNSLGGSGGHNEITMHDAGGSEKLFIRAQKDEVHNTLNDRVRTVGRDEVVDIGKNLDRVVGNDERASIVKNFTQKTGQDFASHVKDNAVATVGQHCSTTVYGCNYLNVVGNYQMTVGGSLNTRVDINREDYTFYNHTIETGHTLTLHAGTDYLLVVDREAQVNVPVGGFTQTVAKVTAFQSGDRIVLRSGDSSIEMTKEGAITIKAKTITLDGEGSTIVLNKDGATTTAKKIHLNA
jgi:type VI secretion system secreted protein VgrG